MPTGNMNRTQPFDIVCTVLHDIAPELDLTTVDEEGDLRMAADLDSIDFLNLMVGIHDLAGVDIPERDYDRVSTLGGLVAYITARV